MVAAGKPSRAASRTVNGISALSAASRRGQTEKKQSTNPTAARGGAAHENTLRQTTIRAALIVRAIIALNGADARNRWHREMTRSAGRKSDYSELLFRFTP